VTRANGGRDLRLSHQPPTGNRRGLIGALDAVEGCDGAFTPDNQDSPAVNPTKLAAFRRALAALRSSSWTEGHYFVAENYTCCRSCGFAEAEEAVKSGQLDGAIFYHQQDLDGLLSDGEVHLAFAGHTLDTAIVGEDVVIACWQQGLSVTWDGSADTRVKVDLSSEPYDLFQHL
jgi:hypothetical protein